RSVPAAELRSSALDAGRVRPAPIRRPRQWRHSGALRASSLRAGAHDPDWPRHRAPKARPATPARRAGVRPVPPFARRGHVIVVKVGGAAGVDRGAVAMDVAALAIDGERIVLVHGASAETDRLSEVLGH